ncbi:hypothetical protein F7734_31125 [Scytonema sp. UIC 10036]|uniref:TubC N-terminal docking domain-related protein n=1 Tax=Scytonema sp. UIC 10036 TaxID=2304196 RepID=UPI0012DA32B0|nr:hypothetical protein [Scytonema sp. UIC 10036]MUG96553.1 hypothetical protein [Scytonema sp. UIC 10036]
MNLTELLENLHSKDIELWADGDELCYEAPEDTLTLISVTSACQLFIGTMIR